MEEEEDEKKKKTSIKVIYLLLMHTMGYKSSQLSPGRFPQPPTLGDSLSLASHTGSFLFHPSQNISIELAKKK